MLKAYSWKNVHRFPRRGAGIDAPCLPALTWYNRQIIIINHGKKVFDDSLVNLRRLLGDKKIISLTLNKPPPEGSLDGAAVLIRNDLELTLEAETKDIGGFMETLMSRLSVRDISIKEPPMEDIIKVLYATE